ncbi:MAG: MFS transporter [Ignavibacteria bacterium]|nr:MFS transporter [Ignavibacteria bacterium]
MNQKQTKIGIKSFSFSYWLVIIFEFFERGSYYGVMSFLSIYLTQELGFSKEGVGAIKGIIQPLLCFLPILSGAVADYMGYRRTLLFAFSFLGLGYFLTSQMTSYFAVFASLVIMGIGAGTFKPVISGTIAKVTDEKTSTLGFGIFYWSINLGAFLFPMFLVPALKQIDGSYVILAAAIFTSLMILPTIFLFKEPNREVKAKKEPFSQTLIGIFKNIWTVILDWRFILFIFIYSWFWILYFQMFDSVLWYLNFFIDTTPINTFVSTLVGIDWKFDVEHVTVINAFTIILLQLFISTIVRNTKALPTMLTGIFLGTVGITILAFSSTIWLFICGMFIFSIGEMTAHPKYISYLGLLAPQDKKATYMGFGFLYGVFGSSIGAFLGANLYVLLLDNPMISFIKEKLIAAGSSISLSSNATIDQALIAAETIGLTKQEIMQYAHRSEFWLIFTAIGVTSIIAMLLYQKFIMKQR